MYCTMSLPVANAGCSSRNEQTLFLFIKIVKVYMILLLLKYYISFINTSLPSNKRGFLKLFCSIQENVMKSVHRQKMFITPQLAGKACRWGVLRLFWIMCVYIYSTVQRKVQSYTRVMCTCVNPRVQLHACTNMLIYML